MDPANFFAQHFADPARAAAMLDGIPDEDVLGVAQIINAMVTVDVAPDVLDLALVKFLNGSSPQERAELLHMPFLTAAGSGNEGAVAKLIDAGASVGRSDPDCYAGSTALEIAEKGRHEGVVRRLLSQGAAALLQPRDLRTGTWVVVDGLVARPEFNGRTGRAASFDEEKRRWGVHLVRGERLSLKAANLIVYTDPWLEQGPLK